MAISSVRQEHQSTREWENYECTYLHSFYFRYNHKLSYEIQRLQRRRRRRPTNRRDNGRWTANDERRERRKSKLFPLANVDEMHQRRWRQKTNTKTAEKGSDRCFALDFHILPFSFPLRSVSIHFDFLFIVSRLNFPFSEKFSVANASAHTAQTHTKCTRYENELSKIFLINSHFEQRQTFFIRNKQKTGSWKNMTSDNCNFEQTQRWEGRHRKRKLKMKSK